jgi:hypothetical protein
MEFGSGTRRRSACAELPSSLWLRRDKMPRLSMRKAEKKEGLELGRIKCKTLGD